MLDLYECNRKKLKDVTFIYKFLDSLPGLIGMTKIMPPYTFSYSGKVKEDWGVSGIVLIAESHISVHTFPDKGYLSLDIFSCNDFDLDEASEYIVNAFEAKRVERNFLNRGRHFPKTPDRLGQIMEITRSRKLGLEKGVGK